VDTSSLTELLRRRHRSLEARIAALEVDRRARRARVVQLAEELVAHATVEQLVLYPYAEELLGKRDLSVEIERALDALIGVVGGVDDDVEFAGALAKLSAAFETHVDGDEGDLLPMLEREGSQDQLVRMGRTMEDFESALATSRTDGPGFWPETAGDIVSRSDRRN
jgi:hypothetical protein